MSYPEQNNHHNFQNWVLLFLLTLIWGSSYILIKKGLIAFSPFQLACLRISIAGLLSVPITIKGFKLIPKDKYPYIIIMGVVSTGIPAFLFALSMTKSSSSVNGILNSTSPLWTMLVGAVFFGVAITQKKALGVFIGFMGAVVLVLGKGGPIQIDAAYSILPLLATLCYGIGSNITKQKLQTTNPVYATAMSMVVIGVPAFIMLCFTQGPKIIFSGTAFVPALCIAILAIFGTLIAWILFYRLVQRTDALFAASVTYLVPIVAISWGLLDGEHLNLIQLGGMVLILTGVYFTTRLK